MLKSLRASRKFRYVSDEKQKEKLGAVKSRKAIFQRLTFPQNIHSSDSATELNS